MFLGRRGWVSQPAWGYGERMCRKEVSLSREVSGKRLVWIQVTVGTHCGLRSECSHGKRAS